MTLKGNDGYDGYGFSGIEKKNQEKGQKKRVLFAKIGVVFWGIVWFGLLLAGFITVCVLSSTTHFMDSSATLSPMEYSSRTMKHSFFYDSISLSSPSSGLKVYLFTSSPSFIPSTASYSSNISLSLSQPFSLVSGSSLSLNWTVPSPSPSPSPTPAATPVATPIPSPAPTPVATPAATPVPAKFVALNIGDAPTPEWRVWIVEGTELYEACFTEDSDGWIHENATVSNCPLPLNITYGQYEMSITSENTYYVVASLSSSPSSSDNTDDLLMDFGITSQVVDSSDSTATLSSSSLSSSFPFYHDLYYVIQAPTPTCLGDCWTQTSTTSFYFKVCSQPSSFFFSFL